MSRQGTSAGPFLNSSELEYDQSRGWERVEVWAGSETECRTKQTSVVNQGNATRVYLASKADGEWQLRIVYPYNESADETATYTFELDVATIARSVYQSPVLRSRFSDYVAATGLSTKADAACQIVGDLERKYKSGLPAIETDGKYKYISTEYNTRELAILAEFDARMTAAGIAGADKTLAQNLWHDVTSRGVTSFLEYNAVFRRTITAGSPLAVRASFAGANQIWTTDEVVNFEGIPNDGWFILPQCQWHKDQPRVLAAFGRKTQLSYTYTQIRTASGLYYTAYGGATLINI